MKNDGISRKIKDLLWDWRGILKKKFVKNVVQDLTSAGLLGVWGKWVKHAKYIYNIQDFNPEQVLAVGYGTTVNNYLISKRITRAKQLLRLTDMTVDEIGVAVGMTDANYFSRMFRKVEGISPREYRKQW